MILWEQLYKRDHYVVKTMRIDVSCTLKYVSYLSYNLPIVMKYFIFYRIGIKRADGSSDTNRSAPSMGVHDMQQKHLLLCTSPLSISKEVGRGTQFSSLSSVIVKARLCFTENFPKTHAHVATWLTSQASVASVAIKVKPMRGYK